ncbi:hypothetical protein [Polycladomyces abyssicola]|nr:hypothetical protein [Polycladomyces abyssicola]
MKHLTRKSAGIIVVLIAFGLLQTPSAWAFTPWYVRAVVKKPNSQPMIEKKQFGSSQVVITHETDFKMNDTITGRNFKEIKAEIVRATKTE